MSNTLTQKAILIVGASRGLGLGLVKEYLNRGWRVIATVRKAGGDTGLYAVDAAQAGHLEIELVDVNQPTQIASLRQRLAGRTIDVLFVNAGVKSEREETIGEVSTEEFTRVLQTNALSPMRVIETLADLVPADGTIVAMSSFLGSVGGNTAGGNEIYRASKAALNTLLRSYAARSTEVPRTLLAMHPGWVRTEMGGSAAPLDVTTSVRGMADVIATQAGKPGMQFLNYKGETVVW